MPTDLASPKSEFLRRKDAVRYLRARFGFGAYSTLAKLAMTGNGPAFRKIGHRVLYEKAELDGWAQSQISGPRHSTSYYPK